MPDDHFLPNLLVFARLLREMGMAVSPDQISDLARVVAITGVARRDLYYSARALLVRRREDLASFDRAFDLFFRIHGTPQQSILDPTQAPIRRTLRPTPPRPVIERETRRGRSGDPPDDADTGGADKVMTYSDLQVLRNKDFARFTPEELSTARRLFAEMDWWIGARKTRRKRRTPHGPQADLGRLLRQNLKHGTELLHIPRREIRQKPRSLVILADISGSMESYTRIVLHLVHALYHESSLSQAGRVQVFVFGTRLTYIAPDLRRRSIDQALERVAERVVDWAGGTRIGDALKTFNYRWARRVLRSSSVVLVISDGWDRGDLELLRGEMSRLQKSCARLIWLNPLMGQPNFAPVAMGLQAALPYVDDFLPVHNLASLEQVVLKLSSLASARPLRRQQPHGAPAALPAPAKTEGMPLPQIGTSDYVRRTLVMQPADSGPKLAYDADVDSGRTP